MLPSAKITAKTEIKGAMPSPLVRQNVLPRECEEGGREAGRVHLCPPEGDSAVVLRLIYLLILKLRLSTK